VKDINNSVDKCLLILGGPGLFLKSWIFTVILYLLAFSSVSWALQLSLPDRVYQGDLIVGKMVIEKSPRPCGSSLISGKSKELTACQSVT
jgi:hypothetical protein